MARSFSEPNGIEPHTPLTVFPITKHGFYPYAPLVVSNDNRGKRIFEIGGRKPRPLVSLAVLHGESAFDFGLLPNKAPSVIPWTLAATKPHLAQIPDIAFEFYVEVAPQALYKEPTPSFIQR